MLKIKELMDLVKTNDFYVVKQKNEFMLELKDNENKDKYGFRWIGITKALFDKLYKTETLNMYYSFSTKDSKNCIDKTYYEFALELKRNLNLSFADMFRELQEIIPADKYLHLSLVRNELDDKYYVYYKINGSSRIKPLRDFYILHKY